MLGFSCGYTRTFKCRVKQSFFDLLGAIELIVGVITLQYVTLEFFSYEE